MLETVVHHCTIDIDLAFFDVLGASWINIGLILQIEEGLVIDKE